MYNNGYCLEIMVNKIEKKIVPCGSRDIKYVLEKKEDFKSQIIKDQNLNPNSVTLENLS